MLSGLPLLCECVQLLLIALRNILRFTMNSKTLFHVSLWDEVMCWTPWLSDAGESNLFFSFPFTTFLYMCLFFIELSVQLIVADHSEPRSVN